MPSANVSDELFVWLQDFVESAQRPDEIEQFVTTVDGAIIAAIPEIAREPALITELHASTRAHWRSFLSAITHEHRLALPADAIALCLSIARRHHDIGVLLKVYRVANKTVFDILAERTGEQPLPSGLGRDEVLIALWLRAERWIDESVEELIEYFTAERASLAEGHRARRAETIAALLAGAEPSAEAERVLGHALSPWQTAFVVSMASPPDAAAPLFEVAVRLCRDLGLPRPFTTLSGSAELWGWVSTAQAPDLDLTRVDPLLTSLGLRFALGGPLRGPTAFRRSHVQAVAAHGVAVHASSRHHYRDVELVTLLGDGELVRDMVRRVALPLLGPGERLRAVRETVLAWLQSGRNADEAARALIVHPNTVRYRISRAEALLGRPVTEEATALELALLWVEVHGREAAG
ncbi:PucR family transcriptional regulator [Janibacter alittae]|uniref:Helix-turn-helix domain-containing protein n=1 Tax=Janibacter alittae TaxID=3115209 RepID=A0ABZ2MKV6_9MICO